MEPGALLERARLSAGLSTQDLADRAGTSRPTVSAYEHGHKSPTLRTAQRLLEVAGYALDVTPLVGFAERTTRRGRPFTVPDRLARLPVEEALATVDVPPHLEWSGGRRQVDLADRHQRARFYEVVLREGTEADLRRYVDGALLVDLWDDLTLPADIRAGWAPLVPNGPPRAS